MVGPPLAGTLYDKIGSYDWPFFMSGVMMIVSGVMSFFVTRVRNPAKTVDVAPDISSTLQEIPEEDDIPEEEEELENVETVV